MRNASGFARMDSFRGWGLLERWGLALEGGLGIFCGWTWQASSNTTEGGCNYTFQCLQEAIRIQPGRRVQFPSRLLRLD